jgi:hypothetical protein
VRLPPASLAPALTVLVGCRFSMQQPFTPPKFGISAFHCPSCNAYAKQAWFDVHVRVPNGMKTVEDTKICICEHCGGQSIWKQAKMVHPDSSPSPLPNPDLPDEIKTDYNEARSIIARSPRGACGLLRLCVQKLCKFLGESGKEINADIASLVKKGLNPLVQQALDIVRVIGNEAVHPGVIDLKDDQDTALRLFDLVNAIADQMISHPKAVKAMYEKLPEDKRKGIAERDKNKPTQP